MVRSFFGFSFFNFFFKKTASPEPEGNRTHSPFLSAQSSVSSCSREKTTQNPTKGYDYVLRQCRLRGRVDTDGRVGALLEERLNVGVSLVLSAELDHLRKDARFGIGMTVGE